MPRSNRLLHFCGLATVVALAACSLEPTSTMDGGVIQDGGPEGSIPDGGDLCVGLGRLEVVLQPQQVDFGDVVVGTTAVQSLGITNCSGIDVSLTIGALRGNDQLLFASVPSAGASIALKNGEAGAVSVQYTPVVVSPTQDQAYFTMTLCSSGTGCQPLISLSGTGVATGLSVAPTVLDFGCVRILGTVPLYVTLANGANAPIHLTADPMVLNAAADGGTSPFGPFQPGAGFPTKDTVVPPGQSVEVPVVFMPAAAGTFLGELDVSTDDSTQSNIKIPLSGTSGCTPDAGI